MRPDRNSASGRSALDLLEETVNLLRNAPPAALAAYYIGAVPFVLAFLYNCDELSSGINDAASNVANALGLAILFIWLKCWQAVFAARLTAAVRNAPPAAWNLRRVLRLVTAQAVMQPAGLVLIPAAFALMIPFHLVHAYYQNLSVFAGGETTDLAAVRSKSWQQARLWPRQNLLGIWLLSPWLLASGLILFVFLVEIVSRIMPDALYFVMILLLASSAFIGVGLASPLGILIAGNIAAVLIFIPWALHHWFGWNTPFNLGGIHAVFNTTFLATVFALTFLVLDPLAKTFHVLRCFYGASRFSGEDLRVELRQTAPGLRAGVAVMLLLLAAFAAPRVSRAAAPAAHGLPILGKTAAANFQSMEVAKPSVQPRRLDLAITDVLKRPEFRWRLPREPGAKKDDGQDSGFLASIRRWLDGVVQKVNGSFHGLDRLIVRLERWLERLIFGANNFSDDDSAGYPGNGLFTLLIILLLVLVAVTAVLALRWRKKRRNVAAAAAVAAAPLPDIKDENVLADQLPSDEWLNMARDLMARGEWRLALRALFLSSLATLAQHHLITIARSKSNFDYLRELRRRAHALPDAPEIFQANILVFERVWYGRDAADAGLVGGFQKNVETMRGAAGA